MRTAHSRSTSIRWNSECVSVRVLVATICACTIAQAQTYTSTIVKSQAGLPNFVAKQVNSLGTVSGYVGGPSGFQASYWSSGLVTLLDQGTGASIAYNLNDANVFVGRSSPNAALWNPSYQGLEVDGEAYGVNNAGWIVGLGFFPGLPGYRPFLWRDGKVQDLGTLGIPGNDRSEAVAVNEHGMVVGWERHMEGSNRRAWRWTEAGGMEALLPPGQGGIVRDVNELGQVLIDGGVWQDGNFNILPQGLELNAINNSGHVVGVATNGEHSIWRGGVRFRIQDLLEPGHQMTIDGALDINDGGQILVGGTRQGQSNYYLLNPVPEPATFVALGLGGAALIARKRRRR
jgi:probable HAF family extracellular repeat protein